MTNSEFYSLIKQQFPFETTAKQDILLLQFSNFIFNDNTQEIFCLKAMRNR